MPDILEDVIRRANTSPWKNTLRQDHLTHFRSLQLRDETQRYLREDFAVAEKAIRAKLHRAFRHRKDIVIEFRGRNFHSVDWSKFAVSCYVHYCALMPGWEIDRKFSPKSMADVAAEITWLRRVIEAGGKKEAANA